MEKIKNKHSPENHAKQFHRNTPNVESDQKNKELDLKLKCIAFIQSCKRLKRFTFNFVMNDYKNEFYKS